MDDDRKTTIKLKRMNYSVFGLVILLVLAVAFVGFRWHDKYSFTTEKWVAEPETRTLLVDDLLAGNRLTGMSEDEIIRLLGEHDNDRGYFNEEDRFVYYMGPERGWISIDSEWLILDFENGIVAEYDIVTD